MRVPLRKWWFLGLRGGLVLSGVVVLQPPFHELLPAWTVGWTMVLSLVAPTEAFLLLTVFVVFFQQSIWYVGTDGVATTLYELEVLQLKPVEFLLAGAVVGVLIRRGRRYRAPRVLKALWVAWIAVVALGIVVAIARRNPVSDMLVLSEFRNLLYMPAIGFLAVGVAETSAADFARVLGAAVAAKVLFALPNYLGVESQWVLPTAAPGYVGSRSAYFGGDPDVAVAVLATLVGLASLVAGRRVRPEERESRDRLGPTLVIVLCAAAVLLSVRRGGVLALCTGGIAMLAVTGSRRLAAASVVTVAAMVVLSLAAAAGIAPMPRPLDDLIVRFSASDERAQVSNLGHLLDVQDGARVVHTHPLLGAGVGARIASGRRLMYGVKEESLIVHQGLIHTWAKFGVSGLCVFLATILFPVVAGWSRLRDHAFGGLKRDDFALTLGTWAFVVADAMWQMFTPPFYQNFRRTFIFSASFAVVLSYRAHRRSTEAGPPDQSEDP